MSTRRMAALGTALSLSLALGACSSGDVIAQSSPQSAAQSGSSQSGADPNLDEQRISSVLAAVQATLDKADASGDPADLESRLIDPALQMRGDQYRLAKATGSAVTPLDLGSQTATVTNSASWPRAVFNFGQATDTGLPAVFVLTQADARSDYMLQSWVRLLGGVSLTTRSIDEGSPYIDADSTGFVMTPGEAISSYVDMLNAGDHGNDGFTSDEFATTYLDEVKQLDDSVKAAGSVKAKAKTGDFPVTGILLQDGSALVAGSFTYTHTYARTVARSTLKLGGSVAALNEGDDSVIGTVTVQYLVNVLIKVPVTGKSQLVGAERAIESTTRDDNAKPEGE